MSRYVKIVEATGVYGRFDFRAEFTRGVNIIYGRNGTGKTTLLHILANALNGQYSRFLFFDFRSIRIGMNDVTLKLERAIRDGEEQLLVKRGNRIVTRIPADRGRRQTRQGVKRREIELRQLEMFEEDKMSVAELKRLLAEDSEIDDLESILPVAYFPAFRTMIDAWMSSHEERERRIQPPHWTNLATKSARRWFGDFVPPINYPSLIEIERRLTDEIHEARMTIGRADRELLSQAFLDIFESLSERKRRKPEQPEAILESIRSLFDRLGESPLQEESTLVTKVYSKLRESILDLDLTQESELTAVRVLSVYRRLLENIVDVQERSFEDIQGYLESVNQFLDDKQLIVDPRIPRYRGQSVGIRFEDNTSSMGLRALSSGERQIVTLIYAATHMSKQQAVLIDEPEISLHVDWQRQLLGRMSRQIGSRQIIACTHSPVVGADFEDYQKELILVPTQHPKGIEEAFADEDEEVPL